MEKMIPSVILQSAKSHKKLFKWEMKQKILSITHNSGIDFNSICYPPNLEELTFYYKNLRKNPVRVIVFPKTIISLTLHTDYSLKKIKLPECIKSLNLGPGFNRDIKEINFPSTLTHLNFYFHMNENVDLDRKNFPKSLI
jgi:hypothetical protein